MIASRLFFAADIFYFAKTALFHAEVVELVDTLS
jgi:hypothetical protein